MGGVISSEPRDCLTNHFHCVPNEIVMQRLEITYYVLEYFTSSKYFNYLKS